MISVFLSTTRSLKLHTILSFNQIQISFCFSFCPIDQKQLKIQTSSRRHTITIQSQSIHWSTIRHIDKPKPKKESLSRPCSRKIHNRRRNTQHEIVDRNRKTIPFKIHTLSIRSNIRPTITTRWPLLIIIPKRQHNQSIRMLGKSTCKFLVCWPICWKRKILV